MRNKRLPKMCSVWFAGDFLRSNVWFFKEYITTGALV